MKCLDDCHTYELDLFLNEPAPEGIEERCLRHLHFYEMREDGTKFNGVTNEEVLRVLIHRLGVLNEKFPCPENKLAINHLTLALDYLNARTRDRVSRHVEGTHSP